MVAFPAKRVCDAHLSVMRSVCRCLLKKWCEQGLAGRLVSSDSFPGSHDEQHELNSACTEVGVSLFPLPALLPRQVQSWALDIQISTSSHLRLSASFLLASRSGLGNSLLGQLELHSAPWEDAREWEGKGGEGAMRLVCLKRQAVREKTRGGENAPVARSWGGEYTLFTSF